MNRNYFRRVEIDKESVKSFLNKLPKLKEFISEDEPFFLRVCVVPFPGLLHAIISQNETNENVIKITTELDTILKSNITEKEILKLGDQKLNEIFNNNKDKVNLIKQICQDSIDKKLDLNKLSKQTTKEIIDVLSKYQYITKLTIKEFCLFTCGKRDVFLVESYDFILGLLKYTKIKNWTLQDINKIMEECKGHETLFTLCMIKIRFSGAK